MLADLQEEIESTRQPTIVELLTSIAPMLKMDPARLAQESLLNIRDKLGSLLSAREVEVESMMKENQVQEAEAMRVDNIKLDEVMQRLQIGRAHV